MISIQSIRNGLTSLGRGSVSLTLTRGLMKTRKAAAKRWLKSAHGFKRGIPGRQHGNAGWSQSYLKGLTGRMYANSMQTRKLKKLLPYH